MVLVAEELALERTMERGLFTLVGARKLQVDPVYGSTVDANVVPFMMAEQ